MSFGYNKRLADCLDRRVKPDFLQNIYQKIILKARIYQKLSLSYAPITDYTSLPTESLDQVEKSLIAILHDCETQTAFSLLRKQGYNIPGLKFTERKELIDSAIIQDPDNAPYSQIRQQALESLKQTGLLDNL